MNQDDHFLKRAFLKNLFPLMFSVLGGTINALIDSIFVSRVVGSSALAAVNLCMPIYLALCTIGSLIAGGANVLAAQELGKERLSAAERYYHLSLTLSLTAGAFVAVLGAALCRPISGLLAQGGRLSGYVFDYCLVSLLGAIPTIMIYIPTNFLQLDGKTKDISVMVGLMVTFDVALDALFMLPLGLGLRGAALASVVSTLIATLYGFFALGRGVSNFHLHLCRPKALELGKLARFGSPAAFRNLFDAIKLLSLNTIILAFGGEAAAATWAVLNTISELSVIITSGVPRAGAPMMSVYYTARENSRIRILLRIESQIGLALSGAFALGLGVLNVPIRNLFHLGTPILFPLLCLGIAGMLYLMCGIWDTYFQSIGQLTVSNAMLAARDLVFPVGAAFALALLGGPLWLFLPLAGALTLLLGNIVTGVIAGKSKNTKRPLSRYLLLDDSLERENRVIDFSIPPDMARVCDASEQIRDFCTANNMGNKQAIRLGLAIEELLNVLIEKIPDIRSVDLRAFAMPGTTGLRIRYAGQSYDPFEDTESDMDFLMGINMLKKMSELVRHSYTLGTNTLNIMFEVAEEDANARVSD